MNFKTIFTVFLMTLSAHANAAYNANLLLSMCDSGAASDKELVCRAYFQGVNDGLGIAQAIKPVENFRMSAQTLINVFIKNMHDHPVDGDKDPYEVIQNALINSGNFKQSHNDS